MEVCIKTISVHFVVCLVYRYLISCIHEAVSSGSTLMCTGVVIMFLAYH